MTKMFKPQLGKNIEIYIDDMVEKSKAESILFGYLKHDLFLIFSKTWCCGSRSTLLTTWGVVDLDCPAKFPLGSVIVVFVRLEIPLL